MDAIASRLQEYLSAKGLSAKDFERITGLGNGTCAKIGNRTRQTTFNRISKSQIDLSINWLLTGEGSMLREPEGNAVPVGDAVAAIPESLTPVRLFEVNPTATFQEFCSGVSEKPLSIGVQPEHGEVLDDSYCVFEIFGESMSPQIQPHAKILCREIPPTKWHTLHDGVVAIAYADKFVIKRILSNHLEVDNFLTLGSDNPDYPEKQTVQLSDIRAIFQASRIISSKIF